MATRLFPKFRLTLRWLAFLVLLPMCGPVPAIAQTLLRDGTPVKVRTRAIDAFRIGHEDARFGKLTFLGGLELLGANRMIGGLSGLVSLDDGNRFLAVTDNGHWVSGSVEQAPDGRPLDITDVRHAPLLGPDDRTLVVRWGHDTEALALAGGTLYVSAETKNAIYRYPWPLATGRERMEDRVALPEEFRTLRRNAGLEAVAAAPKGSPLEGRLVAVAETAPSDAHNLVGYILGGEVAERFEITRLNRFDATDAAFLPNGDLVLMERRFNLRDLIGLRLRRFDAGSIRSGAVLEGETLLEADFGYQIDNMEALAVHRNAAGEIILTLLSDDNRSLLQRTLFLRFRLDG